MRAMRALAMAMRPVTKSLHRGSRLLPTTSQRHNHACPRRAPEAILAARHHATRRRACRARSAQRKRPASKPAGPSILLVWRARFELPTPKFVVGVGSPFPAGAVWDETGLTAKCLTALPIPKTHLTPLCAGQPRKNHRLAQRRRIGYHATDPQVQPGNAGRRVT